MKGGAAFGSTVIDHAVPLPALETLVLALVAIVTLSASACGVNPASGRRERGGSSEAQDIEIGKAADGLVREEMGIDAEKPDLQKYVVSVGSKLVEQSERSRLTFSFEVVDTSDVNAFALPGGYVYVTRGLLAELNSEDELAAVLGHEIAHVTARHALARPSLVSSSEAPSGVSPPSPQETAGRPSSSGRRTEAPAPTGRVARGRPDSNVATGAAQRGRQALRLALHGYSGDDEREADERGAKYVKRAGYNPRGEVDLVKTLARLEKTQPGRVEPWFASHPATSAKITSERIASIGKDVGGVRKTAAGALPRPIRREEYLQRIEGLVMGSSNSMAWLAGERYVNKRYDYSLAVPKGWTARLHGADLEMTRAAEGSSAEMKVQSLARPGASGDVARDYARSAVQDGFELVGPVTRAGLPAGEAGVVRVRSKDESGKSLLVRRMFLVRFDRAYVLTFTVPEDRAEATETTFMTLTGSIDYLAPDELPSPPPPRLALYRAKEGDTWSSLATNKSEGKLSGVDLAGFNGQDEGEGPEPGLLVKIPPPRAFE